MKNFSIKKTIAAMLCLAMLISAGLTFASCNKEEEQPEAPIKVWRLTEDIEEGKRVGFSKLEQVERYRSQLPEGVIEATEDAPTVIYYASTDMLLGDYLVEGKITTEAPEKNTFSDAANWITNQNSDDYIIVKPTSGDMTEALQKIIDENPGRTIYFPDGVYTVSKSLVISTEPEKRVSLRLSQYAVISAVNSWKKGEPVIHFGKGETADESDIDAVGARCYVSGGTIDGKERAIGIKIDGKGNILINHIALKNILIGVEINTDNVDIDSITGTANSSKESGYILINGSHNTVTNLRMCEGYYGVKLLKENNTLRNLHPLIGPMREDAGTIGFWDLSSGNFYDYCYGDQHAMTFKLCDGNTSVLNGCYGYWYSEANGRHYGIYADGRFNSVVYGTRIDMCHSDVVSNAYIIVKEDGGDGKIVNCYFQQGDDFYSTFAKYLYNS